ncbi:MAG TPA: hypothetical protein VF669_16845 [Tepidisphaeraceae bacterium]|jgi:hypothetical protein
MKRATFILALTLAALVGCSNDQRLFGPSLMPRAEAGKSIANLNRRDEALRSVALDAIHDGDAVVANEAIDNMRPTRYRDEVAARCARSLAKDWRAGEATGIAKKIGDVTLRDQVLMEIALGRP